MLAKYWISACHSAYSSLEEVQGETTASNTIGHGGGGGSLMEEEEGEGEDWEEEGGGEGAWLGLKLNAGAENDDGSTDENTGLNKDGEDE